MCCASLLCTLGLCVIGHVQTSDVQNQCFLCLVITCKFTISLLNVPWKLHNSCKSGTG